MARTDFLIVARRLLRGWRLTLAVVVQLGVGVGSATLIYELAHTLLFQSVPYRDPSQILVLVPEAPLWRHYEGLRERKDLFLTVTADTERAVNISFAGGRPADRALQTAVTDSYLALSGAATVAGRLLTPPDFARDAAPVTLLTHRAWVSWYGGSPHAVGSHVNIDGTPHTIAGVLSPDFSTMTRLRRIRDHAFAVEPSLVVPLKGDPMSFDPRRTDRTWRGLTIVARPQPGISRDAINSHLSSWLGELNTHHDPSLRFAFRTLEQAVTEGLWLPVGVAAAAAFALLLISVGNVLGSIQVRLMERRRDLLTLLCLGAPPSSVYVQAAIEAAFVSIAGVAVAVLVAIGGLGTIRRLGFELVGAATLRLDWRTVLFAIGLVCVSTAVLGIVAAVTHLPRRPDATLPSRAESAPIGGPLSLVAVSISLAVPLLAVTIGVAWEVLERAAVARRSAPPGILTAELSLDPVRYGRGRAREYFRALLADTRQIAGVRRAAFVDLVPAGSFVGGSLVSVNGESSFVDASLVSQDYFSIMGISVVAGRLFEDGRPRAGQDLVVNEAFARRFWAEPHRAIGQRVLNGTLTVTTAHSSHTRPLEHMIVGVVTDSRDGPWASQVRPKMYSSYATATTPATRMTILLQADTTDALAPALRALSNRIDPEVPLANVLSLEQIARSRLVKERVLSALLVSFTLAALCVACVGLFSSMSHSCIQRRRDIGVRLALGGTPQRVVLNVMRRGISPLAWGVELGAALSVIALSLLRGLVDASLIWNAATVLMASAITVGLAVIAMVSAAWRVARLDPAEILRSEEVLHTFS